MTLILILCVAEARISAFTEDDRSRRTCRGTGGLHAFLQPLVVAELAFYDLGIPTVPLKFRHFKRASDLAITAADTKRTVPGNSAPVALLQGSERATGDARRIEAVHALPLDEGELITIRLLIQLNNVLGLCIQASWHVPDAAGKERVRR